MFTLKERKRIFAETYLSNPDQIFAAAAAAWPDDVSKGLSLAQEWVNDPDVQKYCTELSGLGIRPHIPTKSDIIKEAMSIVKHIGTETKDRLSALKFIADVCGYMPTAQTNIAVNNHLDSKVLVVPAQPSDIKEFELKAKEQQRKLIEHHVTKTIN